MTKIKIFEVPVVLDTSFVQFTSSKTQRGALDSKNHKLSINHAQIKFTIDDEKNILNQIDIAFFYNTKPIITTKLVKLPDSGTIGNVEMAFHRKNFEFFAYDSGGQGIKWDYYCSSTLTFTHGEQNTHLWFEFRTLSLKTIYSPEITNIFHEENTLFFSQINLMNQRELGHNYCHIQRKVDDYSVAIIPISLDDDKFADQTCPFELELVRNLDQGITDNIVKITATHKKSMQCINFIPTHHTHSIKGTYKSLMYQKYVIDNPTSNPALVREFYETACVTNKYKGTPDYNYKIHTFSTHANSRIISLPDLAHHDESWPTQASSDIVTIGDSANSSYSE